MNSKTINNKYKRLSEFEDEDFVFDNNDDGSKVTFSIPNIDDPFRSQKSETIQRKNHKSTSNVKIGTITFLCVLSGLSALLIYASYNPDLISFKSSNNKLTIFPTDIEAKVKIVDSIKTKNLLDKSNY